MHVEFLDRFSKDLDGIASTRVRSAVLSVIESVESARRLSDIPTLKKLAGYKHAYRIRVGDYRIGLFIENSTVQFARIAHRKDIYRMFP